MFIAIVSCSFSVFAQMVNPQFSQYRDNVVKELNGEKVLALQQKEAKLSIALDGHADDSRWASAYRQDSAKVTADKAGNATYQELVSVRKEIADAMKTAPTQTLVTSDPRQFSRGIANDLKSSSGPRVVGFLAGFSSAGHDAGVIENVNTMQKAAAQYFGLNANSSYGLINGASVDGGINEQFDKAVKNGSFTPAVDPKNFKSYGAVSVNIGEWGGMMTTNRAVLLADTPAGSYEMKTGPKAASENPLSLAEATRQANASAHIMLTEGGEIGLKEVLEYLNNHHKPGTKALVHLGIGYDGTNPTKDKGMRGASFLARHLALNPELIDTLEKSGVKFMAVDAASGRHYSSIKDYLRSADWKTQQIKFSKANIEINSDEFKKKKQSIIDLEKAAKEETDKDKKKQLNNKIGALKGEVALTENRVNSEAKITEYVGELSKVNGYKSGSGSLEKVAKASAATVEANKKSGTTVDPAAAAKAATKGVK